MFGMGDWLVFVRVALGFFWIWHVATDRDDPEQMKGALIRFVAEGQNPRYRSILEKILIPRSTFVSYFVTGSELCAGLSFILGIIAPVMAILMIFLNINFVLARPKTFKHNILPLAIQFMILFSDVGIRWALVPLALFK